MSSNNNSNEEDDGWGNWDYESFRWRDFIFGDYHAETHHFVEKSLTRFPKEIGCAFAASFFVSPLVSIIDKCIVQDISGTAQFVKAITDATKEMVGQPGKFLNTLSFRLTFLVYFGTYAVANLAEMGLDAYHVRDDEKRKTIKVAAASPANIGLLAWRDSVFARVFSAGQPKASTPMRTFALFAARDSATMYATFYSAPQAAEWLQDEYGVERNVAELSMALGIPVITQFVTAPLHIHAMDYVNKPVATYDERMAVIKGEFNKIAFARGLRILPAFGIGSFSNNKFRELFIRQPNEELLLTRRVTRMLTRQPARPPARKEA